MIRAALWVVTLLRVALIPVFLWLGTSAQQLARAGEDPTSAQWAVIGVLGAMGLSDVLDGWMARRFDLSTQIGAVTDAVADKLVQVTLVAFFAFSRGPAYAALPLWFLAILVGRDAVLGGGLLFAKSRDVPIRVVHRPHGRLTSGLVFVVLAWLSLRLPHWGVPPLVLLTALVVVASAAVYLDDGIRQARDVLRSRP